MEDVVDQFYQDLAAKPRSDVLILAWYYGIEGSYPVVLQQIAERHALSFRSGKMNVQIGNHQVMDNVTIYSHYSDANLKEIAKLTQLKTLELYTVTTIPPEICSMDIEKLVIEASNFTFPPCFSSFTHLSELLIDKCVITNTDQLDWSLLKTLTKLSLKGTRNLSLLPFMALRNLKVLIVNRTMLGHLPSQIRQLSQLEELDLSESGLAGLPAMFKSLTKLTNVSLNNNRLTAFPEVLFDLPIQTLDLSWNNHLQLPQRDYPFLSLNVSHCSLYELPDFSRSAIKILNASGNNLRTFPLLPESIEEIYYGFNQLGSFPDLKNYPFLKIIDLKGNHIPITPDLLEYLPILSSGSFYNEIYALSGSHVKCYNPYTYLKNTQSEVLGNLFGMESLTRDQLLDEVRSRKVSDSMDFLGVNRLDVSQLCNLLYSEIPSLEWIEAQRYYTHHFSPKWLLFLKAYEHNGDMLLNSWIRLGFSVTKSLETYFENHESTFKPMIKEYLLLEPQKEYLSDFLTDFYLTLHSIIWNAPEVDREFVVYRGQTGNHPLTTSIGYNSNSIDYHSASRFVKLDGYMVRTTIPKGSKCFLLTGENLTYQEYEVLLPNHAQFNQVSSVINKKYHGRVARVDIPTFDRTYVKSEIQLPWAVDTGKKLTDYFVLRNYIPNTNISE